LKKCSKCGETKPVTEFYKSGYKKRTPGESTALNSRCKECVKADTRARAATRRILNPPRVKLMTPKHIKARARIAKYQAHFPEPPSRYNKNISLAIREWAVEVKELHNYVCQKCGDYKKKMDAHHIVPVRDNPDLAWDISNGTCLCRRCHRKLHVKLKAQEL